MQYSKAPVSEVIVGVTFENPVLNTNQVFAAQAKLNSQYPITEVRPPLANETLVGFRLSKEMDPDKTGPFLVRMRTEDRKWMCQIQRNKLYMNWIRADIEDVGSYVGFSAVVDSFLALCDAVAIDKTDLVHPKVKYLDVTYHDRIEWQQYVSNISQLNEIMNFQPPDVGAPDGFNNVFSSYTYRLPELGGYGILSLNTQTSPNSTQVLKFENATRGILKETQFDEWIHRANAVQVKQFERMFTEETLQRWV